jgi:hypothetical protein
VQARRPGRPIRACTATAWCGAALGRRSVEEERREADTRVPHASESKEKDKGAGCWAARLRGLMGMLGRWADLGRKQAQVRS